MDGSREALQARPAAEVCQGCRLERDVSSWLADEPDAASFLDRLLEAGAGKDAARFLCHALAPREVVWWAWDCAGSLEGGATPEATAALEAVGAWLVEPDDARRRAAKEAADRCGLDQPAGCAALAAFLAEGSLAPADLEPVPPPPGACAKAAAGAIVLAAIRVAPEADERAGRFVARWFELAALPRPWNTAAESDAPAADDSGYDTDLRF